MIIHEHTEGIIIARTISIPLNGEPPLINFQLNLGDGLFRNFTDILENYNKKFIRECIGKTVQVTFAKDHSILEIDINEEELDGIE